MKVQIPLKYSDSFVSLQNNVQVLYDWKNVAVWMTSTEKKYCWNVGGVVYVKSREAQRVYQEHFPNSVSRLSYVCFCGSSPMGNGYICSEQAQHRAKTISSHTAI